MTDPPHYVRACPRESQLLQEAEAHAAMRERTRVDARYAEANLPVPRKKPVRRATAVKREGVA